MTDKISNLLSNDNSLSEITRKQAQNIEKYTLQIIEDLPPKAVAELMGGYEDSCVKLIGKIHEQVSNVMNFPKTLETEKLEYLAHVEFSMDSSLKKLSYNYFKTTCLPRFRQEWRNLEFGNLVQLYPNLCITAQRGSGKCESPETEVVMYDGTLKKMKDIAVGDKVMGVDSTPRTVLMVHSGEDEMYEIEQTQTLNYTVNSQHELHLIEKVLHYDGRKYLGTSHRKINIPTKDFEKLTNYKKGLYCGYRVRGWELPEISVPIEPYYFGLWLSDGNKNDNTITDPDIEIAEYISSYAKKLGMAMSDNIDTLRLKIVNKTKKPGAKNYILDSLRELGVINNKHIPEVYMRNSIKNRMELLAGILDGDGHYDRKKNSFELTFKEKELVEQVQQLCWSLGFRCSSVLKKTVKLSYVDKYYTSYRIFISGDTYKIPNKVERKKAVKSKCVRDPQKSKIKIKNIGVGKYVGISLDGDHLYLGKDGTVKKNSYEFTFALPLWRMYSYDTPSFYERDTIDNHNRKETLLVTNVETLGREHVDKVIEEIKFNDIIGDKLNPNGKATLGNKKIITETGSMMHIRGAFGFARGLHVGFVICDDLPDESSLYSQEQRSKIKERVYGTFAPIVEPGGHYLISGTVYHEDDIYATLKKDKRFKVFEYPAVMPDGRLLSPDRFTFEKLTELRESLGSIVFTREYLITPMSSDASIFPREFLEKSVFGMENIGFAHNIHEYPFKLKKVVIACDFAISANVGADYSVFVVMGIDNDENYYLVDIWRKRGATPGEQINQIVSMNHRFKPNQIIIESNGFQRIMGDLIKNRGLRNVKEFTTTSKVKKDSYEGLPSASAIFERGQIRFPYKEGETRNMVETIFGEFSSIGYIEDKGKLESTSQHDDTVMAIFIAITTLRENTSRFKAYSV